jgi:hypothetical protein
MPCKIPISSSSSIWYQERRLPDAVDPEHYCQNAHQMVPHALVYLWSIDKGRSPLRIQPVLVADAWKF